MLNAMNLILLLGWPSNVARPLNAKFTNKLIFKIFQAKNGQSGIFIRDRFIGLPAVSPRPLRVGRRVSGQSITAAPGPRA
jgi:hypothetical protein